MVSKIKEYFWVIVLGAAILFVTIVLKDQNMMANLQSMLRKKKVEDDVNEIKAKLKMTEAEAVDNEEKLVELAEKLKEDQKKAKEATEEEIQEFWDGYFD